jgi:hypothetical protein
MVSCQTLIPHGGIGQFTKSFCDLMHENNTKVDIITDKEPAKNEFINSLKANIISPLEPLPYTDHNSIFMYGDTYCYERMANFRNSVIEAFEHNLYDILICNTFETVQVASNLNLSDVVQIIAYTHLESQIFSDTTNPFINATNISMRKQLELDNIFVGTQSLFNKTNLGKNSYHLPIPITEKKLLKESNKDREGVLFIGRWEEGKNPELFLELIEKTKLPAKVMTSPNGVKKFTERLQNLNVKYDVRSSIVGDEKVDFICSSRVAFNPSIVESYGMAFYEQISQLPTFCLEDQRWTKNFNERYYFKTNKKNMTTDILYAYDTFKSAKDYYSLGALDYINLLEDEVFSRWETCFNDFSIKKSNSNTAKICNHDNIKIKDYFRILDRSVLCIDDIRSVLTNKHKFNIIYTDNDTYLTKDKNFKIEEETTDSLFNFE